jgi:hypothetical protein
LWLSARGNLLRHPPPRQKMQLHYRPVSF